MKRILLLLSFFLSASAWAQGAADICTGLPLGNNCYLSARRGDGFQEIKVLKVDLTDDTVLNADAGDTIKFSIGGTTEMTLDNDSLTTSGTTFTFSGSTYTFSSAGDVILKTDADANRLLTFGASSDTALTLLFGDSGTTANQTFFLGSSTADADDDSTFSLGGGGAVGTNGSRGAYITLEGNEAVSSGQAIVSSGSAGGSDVTVRTADDFVIGTGNGTAVFRADVAANTFTGEATGGGFVLSATGSTLAVDSGTAASACKGTATANGTTAVTVSTTCAATGAIVFLQRTSAPSGTAQCWFDTIVNGTSFNLDCDGAETGTFAWWILKEG